MSKLKFLTPWKFLYINNIANWSVVSEIGVMNQPHHNYSEYDLIFNSHNFSLQVFIECFLSCINKKVANLVLITGLTYKRSGVFVWQ